MFQGQYEAGAPEAQETRTPDALEVLSKEEKQVLGEENWQPVYTSSGQAGGYQKVKIEGGENYAKLPPVTWRNRHRRPPKDKTPITKIAALDCVAGLRRKYQALVDSGRLVERTNHIRLLGDLAHQLSELIARICDVKSEELRDAVQQMRRLSKKAFGGLRVIEAGISAPTPDHVSSLGGESLRSARVHYRGMQNVCDQFQKIVGPLSHDESQRDKAKASRTKQKKNGITYLPPNPHDWRLPLGAVPEERMRTSRTEVFQRFLDYLPEQNSYNPNWRRS
jgi:hypothetical protein